MFYKSHKKSSARAFDHLYDPLHTVANFKDFQKENYLALNYTAPINIYTNYDAMFSDSILRPRSFYVLQRNPLPRLPPFNDPLKFDSSKLKANVTSGSNRVKYFNIPIASTKPLSVRLDTDSNQQCVTQQQIESQGKPRTIACQTMYREQSAQTKPYLPDVKMSREVENLEIMQITDFIDENTILGQYETDMILRARKRRNWEKMLLETTSAECDFNERRKILEAFEWEMWLAREEEMEQIQSTRLEYVESILKKRSESIVKQSAKKIDDSVDRLTAQHKGDIEKIYNEYHRSIRKLKRNFLASPNQSKTLKNIEKKNFSARKTYSSRFERDKPQAYSKIEDIQLKFLNSYELNRAKMTMSKTNKSAGEIYRGFYNNDNLRVVYETLKAFRLKQSIYDRITKILKSIEKPTLDASDRNEFLENKLILSELLKLLNKLEETINESPSTSIDSILDLLHHKFNSISLESIKRNKNLSLLNQSEQEKLVRDIKSIHRNELTSVYLEEIVSKYFAKEKTIKSSLQNKNARKSAHRAQSASNTYETRTIVLDLIENYIWPEIFSRLDQHTQHNRKQIRVDLKRLTSDEELMVKDVGCDCIDSILFNMK